MNPALEKLQKEAPLKSQWRPTRGIHNLPWKVVRHFAATDDNGAVLQLEKYQGGRNSPAYLTLNRLRANFTRIDPHSKGLRKRDGNEIENYEV